MKKILIIVLLVLMSIPLMAQMPDSVDVATPTQQHFFDIIFGVRFNNAWALFYGYPGLDGLIDQISSDPVHGEFFTFYFAKKYGLRPTAEWQDTYGYITLKVQYNDIGNVMSIPRGTELVFKTPEGMFCGYGWVKQTGMLEFTPVYHDDPYTPRYKEGVVEGDLIYIYVSYNYLGEKKWYLADEVIAFAPWYSQCNITQLTIHVE